MTKACPLKAAFITSKLDEIQPCWRDGADVTQETKSTIRSYAQEKYKDILEDILEDADESISIKSIENAIGRVRKKLGIINLKGKRNSPVRGRKHQIDSDFAGCTMNLEAKDMSDKEVYPHIGEQSLLISNELFDQIKRLINQYSLEKVKRAISLIEGAIFQNCGIPCNAELSEGKIVDTCRTTDEVMTGTDEMRTQMQLEKAVQEFNYDKT